MSQQFLINDQGEVIGIDSIERIVNALGVITIYFIDGTSVPYTYPGSQADIVMAEYQRVFASLSNGKTLHEMISPGGIALIAATSLTLTSVTANTGHAGDVVVVVGTGFLNLGPNIYMTFDGLPVLSITVASDTSLQCVVPGPHAAGAIDVAISLTSNMGAPVTLVGGFTYL